MMNHTSAFRFKNLPSIVKSFQTLKISSVSSKFAQQLVSLSDMTFLYTRTSTTIALNEPENKSLVFLTGDWNTQVGKNSNSMPWAIVLVVLMSVFEITVWNFLSISVLSTTFSLATKRFNTWEKQKYLSYISSSWYANN